ncbi:hypothetical protein TNCV_2371461 [Trichonephila clavipes]|nr:hypothetical protein TNCV_2371461 [Trichonephila clavipes]
MKKADGRRKERNWFAGNEGNEGNDGNDSNDGNGGNVMNGSVKECLTIDVRCGIGLIIEVRRSKIQVIRVVDKHIGDRLEVKSKATYHYR